jgi:hypothetical protein
VTRPSWRRWLAGAAALAGALAALAGSPDRPSIDRAAARPVEPAAIPVDAAAIPVDAAVATWRRGC